MCEACACVQAGCITLRESERDFYVANIVNCPRQVKREGMLRYFLRFTLNWFARIQSQME